MNKNVIVFPDYQGKACGGDFARSLREMYPEATILAVINGDERETMEAAAKTAIPGILPFITEGKGVVASLLEGYDHIMENVSNFVGQTVVRLDTDEHPIEYVDILAAKAEEIGGVAIGDLNFSQWGYLVPGSLDETVHLVVFPEMYGHYSGGTFRISCAHGYNAYSGEAFKAIISGAWKIAKEAERKLGAFPQWGLDGAMALSAARQGIPVEVIPVPAMSERNRPTPKIFQQWLYNYMMCLAAETVFPST